MSSHAMPRVGSHQRCCGGRLCKCIEVKARDAQVGEGGWREGSTAVGRGMICVGKAGGKQCLADINR